MVADASNVRNSPKIKHRSGLCWAARTVALGVGGYLALVSLAPVLETIMPHDYAVEVHCSVYALVGFVPLLAAAIGWRWHLLGGLLMILTIAGISTNIALNSPPSELEYLVFAIPIAAAALAAGILQLVVWWMERVWRKQG
jgi:hypothetical protein